MPYFIVCGTWRTSAIELIGDACQQADRLYHRGNKSVYVCDDKGNVRYKPCRYDEPEIKQEKTK